MPIVQQGSINTTALVVPDVYVQIIPPQVANLNGVPTNLVGGVGVASWGPVDSPVVFGDMAGFQATFGPLVNRKYDLGTYFAANVLQGANNFVAVRVTDDSDTAATAAVQDTTGATGLTVTSRYTGSAANADQIIVAPNPNNSAAYNVTVARPGYVPELFQNISGTGAALWANIANAINNGVGTQSASRYVVAAVGSSTAAPKLGSANAPLAYTLAGGTDGAAMSGVASVAFTGGTGYTSGTYALTVSGGGGSGAAASAVVAGGAVTSVTLTNPGTGYAMAPSFALPAGAGAGTGATFTAALMSPSSVLVGSDATPREGLYALRGTGVSIAALVDVSDSTTFGNQIAFGLSEGVYMVGTGPQGDSIANAVSTKTGAGVDSYAFKYMFGDWPLFNDTVNNLVRYISPQGYVTGTLANLSPEQSSLNKPLQGVIGTQKTQANSTYSAAELAQLIAAGIDVITNPSPGGKYFSCRVGHNSSSNPLINGDNYTRLTNYIAETLNAGMGAYVGQVITPSEMGYAKGTLDTFLSNMQGQGMIGDIAGGPAFSVILDASNNPNSRLALGYLQADVTVKYLGINEKFLINLDAGTSVQVAVQGQ